MAQSPRTTRWSASLAVLVAFILLAILLVWLLKLAGGERTVALLAFTALGMAGAGVTWHLLRPPAIVTVNPDGDDALLALRQAAERLPRGELLNKPLVLVIGPATSGKTTAVSRSGLDAQLLAGDARGNGAEEPTKAANIWLVRDGVLVEAPGAFAGDSARFTKFVRSLRAPGLAVALGRGEPAPRAIVLCVPSDFIVAADQGRQLDTLAPMMRERLAEAARELGMRVPVYVLFTRADRIPAFETWAAPFTREEVRVPLGAALPFDDSASGAYAERLLPKLEMAFREIVASLAARRSELLTRESTEAQRLAGYELPREFGKMSAMVTRFLVEVTRPSQLGMTPQLRGFWFVGARPVMVRDAAPVAATAKPLDRGATSVFSSAAMGQVAAAASSVARRVPEWVFLDRFFTDVVFGDRSARAAARGGVRVSGMRRALLGGMIAAGGTLGVGVLTSVLGNRALSSRTRDAARAVAALPTVQSVPGTVALPSVEALRSLERLRAILDTVAGVDSSGVPWSLGFGLWSGRELIAAARPVWIGGYRRQLHDDAWHTLADSLRTLPDLPLPTSDYGRSYDMLKTYLVGTTEHARSSASFVSPVLLTSWERGVTPDSAVLTLARQQFETYARLQASAPLWPAEADAKLVGHAREHLGQFAGIDPIYLSMLGEVTAHTKPIRLAEAVPQAAGVVGTGGAVVTAPYTAAGWRAMQDILNDADRFFQSENWVVGDRSAVATRDRTKDLRDIRARYLNDYAAQWRNALKAVSVPRPGSVKESASRLGVLGGAQSPLLAVLALAATNTNVDTMLARAFQPVHLVTPPTVKDKYVSEANEPYVNALLSLQGAMEQLGNLPPATDTATTMALAAGAQTALAQSTQTKVAARQLAQKFAVDADAAQIGPTIAALLEAPINGAEGTLRSVAAIKPPTPVVAAGGGSGGGGGSAKGAELTVILNDRGKQLCKAMERILGRFPFNPDGGDAGIGDVNALLAPGTGSLWAFYDERLVPLLPRQGGEYRGKPANDVTLSPQFVAFFNRMARASNALYADRGSTPRMNLTAKGIAGGDVSIVTLISGDRTLRFGPGAAASPLPWPPGGGTTARLMVTSGGREREVAKGDGPWALFRLASRATSTELRGPTARTTFSGGVVVEFTATGAGPVVQRGALTGPACVQQVTQ